MKIEKLFEDMDPKNPINKGFRRTYTSSDIRPVDSMNYFPNYRYPNNSWQQRNPLAVWKISDLMSLAGPAVSLLLILQALSAFFVGTYLATVSTIDKMALIGASMMVALVLDGITYHCSKGCLIAKWWPRISLLALVTVTPGVCCCIIRILSRILSRTI
jgi:hypothetical protein